MNKIISLDSDKVVSKLEQYREQWKLDCKTVAAEMLNDLKGNEAFSMAIGSDVYSQQITLLILEMGIMKGYLAGIDMFNGVLSESMVTKLT